MMMKTAIFPLLLATLLTGCFAPVKRNPYENLTQQELEMRAFASSFMSGKKLTNRDIRDPNKPAPKVDLDPSPGREYVLGGTPFETLESHPKWGTYVALLGKFPTTMYFEVLGRADCNDWVVHQDVSIRYLETTTSFDTSFTGNDALTQCITAMHRRIYSQKEELLNKADGVLLDEQTIATPEEYHWLASNMRKRYMDGWAIKFHRTPPPEMIHERLKKDANSAIDKRQLQSAAYWIGHYRKTGFEDEIRALLPLQTKRLAVHGWFPYQRDLFLALAMTEADSAPDDVYRTVLLAGIEDNTPAWMIKYSKGNSTVGEVPDIAANVLMCRSKGKETIDLFRKVAKEGTIINHRMAAVRALVGLGDSAYVKELAHSEEVFPVEMRRMVLSLVENHKNKLETLEFHCPVPGFRNKG